MMEWCYEVFPGFTVQCLTADREDWLSYLLKAPQPHYRTPFRIRMLFADLKRGESKVLKRRRVWGRWVYVAGVRLDEGELSR